MLPSPAELEELLAEPGPAERRGDAGKGAGTGRARAFIRYFAALLVVAAVAYVYLLNSGRIQRPEFLAGIPILDNGASTAPFGSGDDRAPQGGSAPLSADERTSDSLGAALSSVDSRGESAAATPAGGAPLSTGMPPSAASDPTVREFFTLADSLAITIRNFQDRSDDFAIHRITCDGLAVGYSAADAAFIALASAHRAARESLDTTAEARYRELVNRMGHVNEDFGASGCPRP